MKPLPQNILIALELAALSNFTAMYYLGFMYGNGVAVNKNINKAIHFLQKAINIDDDPNLLFYLANCYSRRKIKKDLHKAFELFDRAAAKGCGKAMVELGFCYEKGRGVNKDWNKAIDQYRRAIEVGEEVNKDIQKVMLLQNFIGKNNPKTHKVKGWLEDKLPHSTAAPAFDPPIMAGDWKQLTAEEVKICLDKVLTPFEILGLVEKLDGYFGQYARSMPLSFYKNCSLVDIQIYNQSSDMDTLIFSAIFNAENAILLHYDFDLIKSLSPYLLSFSDEKSVIDYLTFCTLYDKEVGSRNYQLISNLKELPCEKEEIQRIQERTKHNFFRPQHVNGSFEIEGYQQFKAVILFDNALWGGMFDVFSDGNYFNSECCDCIIDDVAILRRQYGGVFRTPLRSLNY